MASDGSDNPILDMGLLGMMQPNPYLNPAYANKPLKLPGFYTGMAGSQPPTDAMGKPIQSFVDANNTAQSNYQNQLAAFNSSQPAQGTTLNSTPAGQDNGLTALNDMRNNIVAQNATLQGMPSSLNQGGFGSGNNVLSNTASAQTRDNAIALDQLNRQIASAGQPAAGGPTPPAPPDMRQAYLDALANPGPLAPVGSSVPASKPLGVPSVLNSFLQTHPSGGSKTGGYDNTGFFNTLNQLGRTG